MDINAIWDAIAPYITGTTIGSLIVGIIAVVLKSGFTKAINRIDVKKISKETVDETVSQIQKVAFSHNIQPIVEEQLRKIIPLFNEHLEKVLKQTQDKYEALLNVTIALSQYFENGYGIPDEVKDNLKDAIQIAKDEIIKDEQVENFSVQIDDNNNVVAKQEFEVKVEPEISTVR